MIIKIYAIRDRATDQFNNPVFLVSNGQAIRQFNDAINDTKTENNPMRQHPEDYDLYELGSWNTDTGLFDTGVPKQLAIGKDHVINGK